MRSPKVLGFEPLRSLEGVKQGSRTHHRSFKYTPGGNTGLALRCRARAGFSRQSRENHTMCGLGPASRVKTGPACSCRESGQFALATGHMFLDLECYTDIV